MPPSRQVVTYDLYCTVDLTALGNKHHTVSITYPNVGVAHVGWTGKALLSAFVPTEDVNTSTDNLIFLGTA